jgi:hypothetical protein
MSKQYFFAHATHLSRLDRHRWGDAEVENMGTTLSGFAEFAFQALFGHAKPWTWRRSRAALLVTSQVEHRAIRSKFARTDK